MPTFNFGKYKGLEIKDAPINYIQWVFSLATFYKARIDFKNEVIELLIEKGKINLDFETIDAFLSKEWISTDRPPLETCFVMCKPHNRVLLFSGGNFYQKDTWLRKDDVTHWKPLTP